MVISRMFNILLPVLVTTGILREGRGQTLTGKPQVFKTMRNFEDLSWFGVSVGL